MLARIFKSYRKTGKVLVGLDQIEEKKEKKINMKKN